MSYRTAFALLLALAAASGAAAQSNPPAKPAEGSTVFNNTLQVTGSVISSDANRLVVKNDNGQEMVFIITDKQVDASQFHAGDRVTASYVTIAGTGAVVSKVVSAETPVSATTTTYTPPAAETRVTTKVTEPTPATAPAVTTTVAPVAPVAPIAPVAARPYEQNNEQTAAVLPATASPMPLVALLGLLGAGGAATIRRFRRS